MRDPDEHSRDIALLTAAKRMCCLGYMCAQSGATPAQLDGLGEPFEVANETEDENQTIVPEIMVATFRHRYVGDGCYFGSSELAGECQSINDDDFTSDLEKLIELNAKLNPVGWTVVLVDTPAERAELGGLPLGFAGFVESSGKPQPDASVLG